RYVDLLGEAAPVTQVSHGLAFHFPPALPALDDVPGADVVRVTEANAEVLRPLLPDWLPDVHRSPPLLALVLDGRAVAVCASVRITPRVHEAGVET
ncbi:hypothetical protein, partial [Brachyspira hyodysenteriae]|uniref:hypothetical protein n=1 Tax=Brachyspira hyodysenteriae TaxID=159 RepID=UPI0019D348FF